MSPSNLKKKLKDVVRTSWSSPGCEMRLYSISNPQIMQETGLHISLGKDKIIHATKKLIRCLIFRFFCVPISALFVDIIRGSVKNN